jgi:hypothetical protein
MEFIASLQYIIRYKMKWLQMFCLTVVILLMGCTPTAKLYNNMRPIDIFRQVITGDFDNSQQVAAEIAAGKQVHPLARHVNRVADDKIEGLAQTNVSNGFWIIEESYYTYPGKATEAKPYLFHFSQGKENTVLLKVYQLPARLKKEDIKNSNPSLKMQYNELVPSPTFMGATYTYDPQQDHFTTNAPNDLGNGMKFTLIETLNKKQLIVMELLEKDGKRLTQYDTPIVYDRIM